MIVAKFRRESRRHRHVNVRRLVYPLLKISERLVRLNFRPVLLEFAQKSRIENRHLRCFGAGAACDAVQRRELLFEAFGKCDEIPLAEFNEIALRFTHKTQEFRHLQFRFAVQGDGP